MLNVCMIGHGMMGIWHSEALQRTPDAVLHTVVGRAKPASAETTPAAGRAQSSTEAFAEKYGYKKWTTDLDEALADPEVDIVIIAGPSETHAEMALKSINAGKHTLVEIPIAMNLEGAEAVVAAAKEKGVALGVVHPMRYRTDRHDMVRRVKAGEEKIHSVQGRFFIHRL
jgi:2-hydroxy-4-carboxymuconate semialdehyde hemiacetal dehydrogenase